MRPKTTAIQCADDVFAYLAIQEAERNGMNVPGDISIVGFDGVQLPWFLKKRQDFLSTVWVNAIGVGQTAANTLLERLRDPAHAPRQVLTEVKLLARGSVKRVR